jgi:uncharacterized OB-fold protein
MTSSQELVYVPGHWNIKYEHAAGETVSKFLTELRDHGRVLGRCCPDSGRVLAPPRAFCEQSFVDTDEWVELGPDGHIESFTIVPNKLGAGPETPYAIAYVQLDGADTAMVNLLKGINLNDTEAAAKRLEVGTPVTTVFKPPDEREARITDFHYEPR